MNEVNEVVKATRAMSFVKRLLEQDKKPEAIQAIVLIYDTNNHDAGLFVEKVEVK
ncbi:hypothetical protein LCGC14_0814950 [marine sediment metagenome]|uniref:Uncharacterized protein n=1 Tax=marine sediment metagenome TaxID=412755 RepID=A0A0F9PKL4_9ZZZZ